MPHSHFCDFSGHYWQCDGTALRPLAGGLEPTVCMCLVHQVSMAEGDHSACPVELLACPEHREEQLREVAAPETGSSKESSLPKEGILFQDRNGVPIVGFCPWCNKDFYSMDEAHEHNTDEGGGCPVLHDLPEDDSDWVTWEEILQTLRASEQ